MALEIVTKIAMVMMVMTMTVMTVVVMMSVMEAVRKEAETAAAMTDGYSTV
jgi:ABC-type lipoprotein release transport system permease subunit